MKISLKIAALAAAMQLSAVAQAAVVTFDAPPSDEFFGSSYSEAGLTFTSSGDNMFHWGAGSSLNADPVGDTMAENYGGNPINVALTAGGSFTLNAIDFADVYNHGDVRTIHVNWTDATGSHTMQFNTDDHPGLQTVNFGYAGVTSFSVTGDNWFQMDNVTYSAMAVPEAGTTSMMLGGLAMLGIALRRRKA